MKERFEELPLGAVLLIAAVWLIACLFVGSFVDMLLTCDAAVDGVRKCWPQRTGGWPILLSYVACLVITGFTGFPLTLFDKNDDPGSKPSNRKIDLMEIEVDSASWTGIRPTTREK